MLNQLVESNDHTKENKRRGGFLISTLLVVCSIFASGILWSLFAKDLGMNADGFELSTLIAPLAIADEQPKPPEIQPKNSKPSAPIADVRTKIIQNINETPNETPKISVTKSTVPPRNPNHLTIVGDTDISRENAAAFNSRETGSPIGTGIGNPNGSSNEGIDSTPAAKIPPPPPPFVKKEDVKPKLPPKISLGVINGKATNLVTPPYPPAAKAIHAAGTVSVQVTIDEKGNVISAAAVDGHPLLRQASENAARASKFNPTTLSNEPVKVSGVIVYRFTAQ